MSDHKPEFLVTDGFYTATDLSELFPGTTTQTWARYRMRGKGPAFVKAAGKILYPKKIVQEWASDNYHTESSNEREQK